MRTEPESAHQVKSVVVGSYKLVWETTIADTSGWGWWGAIHDRGHVIKRMDLYHGKEQILMPRSAFSDLAEVLSIKGVKMKGGCKFVIIGGDASESFKAEILVRGDDVASRFLYDPAFPEYTNERTIYTRKAPPDQ